MPMLLKDQDEGSEFELALIEEYLPDTHNEMQDRGWLTLSFRVATGDDSWEETSPCINTFQIRNLLEWLRALAGGDPDIGELELIDPELKFSVAEDDGEAVTVRVDFHLENRPEIAEVDTPTEDAIAVELRLTRDHVGVAAAELEQDLEAISESRGVDRDDLFGEQPMGEIRVPDEDLGMVDRLEDEPEGMGTGEDNAGRR